MKLSFSLILFIIYSFCIGQNKKDAYNFIGVIKISETNFISYRLVFNVDNDKVSGYSVSDLLGPDETKSKIEGIVDRENLTITLKETSLIYTKSAFETDIFCNLEFKFDLVKKLNKLEVPFKGYYSLDNSFCIEGDLLLNSIGQFDKLYQKIQSKSNKIQRKGGITPEQIAKVNEKINSLTTDKISLKSKENLSLIWTEEVAELRFWDDAQFDKDKIEIKLNNTILYTGIVEKDFKTLQIPVKKGNNNIIIRAVDEGEIARNTVAFELISKNRTLLISNELEKDETSRINLFKK